MLIFFINYSLLAYVMKKKKQPCNHFHNILRLFGVLPDFPFATSETIPDDYL